MRGDASSAHSPCCRAVRRVAPVALYYGSRSAGISVYFALLAGAVAPGISTIVRLIKGGTFDGLAVFVMATMLIGVGIALIAGSPRFLLARKRG